MSRFDDTMPPDYFEQLYTRDPDPWRFETSAYEAAKYDATLAALGDRRFRSAFEVGCSIGVLTRRLAERCDALLAVDVATPALAKARERCADRTDVRLDRLRMPEDWPRGDRFDLILLSEVVYYLGAADIRRLAALADEATRPGGLVLLVHWTGETNYPVSGDEAVTLFLDACRTLTPLRADRERDYRLDLLARPDR